MKASLKLREEPQAPLFRAKVPISVIGLPFITAVSAGNPADLSFHLRTYSPTGPSLKLSYHPNSLHSNPFSLTVRSGIGPFGSPDNDSPLVMSAHFNLLGPAFPSFCLQIKPQFGDFSLKKVAVSSSSSPKSPSSSLPHPDKPNGDVHLGGVEYCPPACWEFQPGGGGFLSGAAVTAKSLLPLTRRAMVKFRWGVNYDDQRKLPFLTVDKIGIERMEEPKKGSGRNGAAAGFFLSDSKGSTTGELEVLKGMCFWMGREVEALQRENRSMKECLEELRLEGSAKIRREIAVPSKKPTETADGSGEFDRWRKKKNGRGEERGMDAKPTASSGASVDDVGEELKRAIKAAAS